MPLNTRETVCWFTRTRRKPFQQRTAGNLEGVVTLGVGDQGHFHTVIHPHPKYPTWWGSIHDHVMNTQSTANPRLIPNHIALGLA